MNNRMTIDNSFTWSSNASRKPGARALTGACAVLLACGIAPLTNSSAAALEQSAWSDQTNSKVRLVGAMVPEGQAPALYGGVQLRMDQGWKTYWRNPGDSGVPPSFDWSGSKNVERVEVLYPQPHRFADASGSAIGYSDEVLFPVRITPKRKGEPVTLSLTFDYGLCKDLCIPNSVELSTELDTKAGNGDRGLLEGALARVPKKSDSDALPKVTGISADLDSDAPKMEIDVQFPDGAIGADVFVDNPDVLVPVPKALGAAADGTQRFAIDFPVPEQAKALKGKPLAITLVTEQGASETTWTAQ